MSKRIIVFTGSRADFGLLKPIAEELAKTNEVSWLVSGGHLVESQGYTLQQIKESSSLEIKTVPINTNIVNNESLAYSISDAIAKFADFFNKNKYDLLIVLGDRYEAFAVTLAANLSGLKIAHIYGGEETLGANDNYFRNCITKLSHYHFTSCEKYRQRVIQMGEAPNTVWTVGSIGAYNAITVPIMNKAEIYSFLNIPNNAKFILATYHPVTLSNQRIEDLLEQFINAVLFLVNEGYYFVITSANCDASGEIINKRIQDVAKENEKVKFFYSLGVTRYLNVAKIASAVIGNSSSAVIELPSITNKILDIGDRQKGRERAGFVEHCEDREDLIIEKTLNLVNSTKKLNEEECKNPYLIKNPAQEISLIINKLSITSDMQKPFYEQER